MIKNNNSPNYKKHLFICTKCKHSSHCDEADYALNIRASLKSQCAKLFNKKEVRINASGCLGVCDEGVHVVIYPEEKWFKKVDMSSIPAIIDYIKSNT